MAWNPNIPAVTNRVQDDLDAIRKNFQHLDQLAERVDELQTVSELAERVDELQTVSELAPITNDLQTVSGLAPVAGELQAVSELAPYAQALLDSRIVEMGSNANGEYVRWENGLQVTFSTITFTNLAITSGALGWYRNTGDAARFPWPAAFATGKTPVVIPVPRETEAPLVTVQDGTNQNLCSLLFWRPTSATVTVRADVLAIGWWK